jgi:Na+:H+ antiporter
MDIHVILLVIATLLIVVGLIQPLAARLGLSPTVLLALVGVAIGLGSTVLTTIDVLSQIAPVAKSITNLPIHSDVFLDIFLPMLLFETALNIEVHQMIEDAGPILLLAVVAVLVATFTIGGALGAIASAPLTACLMLGAIVATTDPVAVIAIFRDLGAPARLSRLIEGESLLNDAAAITLFVLLLDMLTGHHGPSLGRAVLTFFRNFAGGILAGYLGARVIVGLMRRLLDLRLAQVTLTLALPYLVYIIADHQLGVSGVVATVTAGLVMSAVGQPKMSPDDWRFLHDMWEQMAFWASSLIFILASLLVPRMLLHVGGHDLVLLFVLVIAALAGRALVLFCMFPILSALRLSQKVDNRFKAVILWGGLRGAVTLALALAVTENQALEPEVRRFVGVLATEFVLFTLLINGTTLRVLISLLGLDLLSPLDQALRRQVLALSRERVSDAVKAMAAEYKFPDALVSKTVRSGELEDVAAAESIASTSAQTEAEDHDLVLGLIALANHERDVLLAHFAERTLSGRIVEESLAAVGRLIDRTRAGGQREYVAAAQRMVDFSRSFRLTHFLHRRFSWDGPLVDRLADRFELLLCDRIVVEELSPYVTRNLAPLIGDQAARRLLEIVRQRRDMTTTALDALRKQYPDYAHLLERRILDKIWLRREELEYRTLFDDGVIGPELYTALRRDVTVSRARVEVRPPLDLGLQSRALVSKVPIFATLTKQQLDWVARLLRPRFAVPDQLLIRDGDVADAMYFLSSGAVEVSVMGTKKALGPGNFFGEMALVTGRRRQGDVRAIGYCQLLVLRARDFEGLLRDNPALQETINTVARTRIEENRKVMRNTAL